ncbi:MAG: ABC transporter substrate-binding protein [Candidatus Dormibacteraceae bacterium]
MWTWYTDQAQAWPQRIAEYEAGHPGVKIQNRIFGNLGDYTPPLEAAVSAGQAPDIFGPANLAITYAKGGVFANLSKLLGKSYLKQFFPSANAEYTYKGNQYGVGWEAQTFGLFYNPALLEKAGVAVPETWDELIATVEPIKKKAGVAPLVLHAFPANGASDFFMPLITQVTNDPQYAIDLDLQLKGRKWTAKPVVEALNWVQKITKSGAIESGSLSAQVADAERFFYQGTAAMLLLHSSVPHDLIVSAPPAFVKEYRVAKVPTIKKGARHWTGNQAGSGLGIYAHSPHVEQAVDFLKFLYQPKGYGANMNLSNAMPVTKAAAPLVSNGIVKQMVSWLLQGDGCPHILFGTEASEVGNAVVSILNGSAGPHQAAQRIQQAAEQSGGG